MILGNFTADQLRAGFERDMQHAQRVGWAQVRKEGELERFKAWFWRLWKQML